jgi:hypothetical protein
MKLITMTATCLVLGVAAFAQTGTATAPPQDAKPTCKTQATEKKLAGAALNSFMKKCQTDAQASCDAAAADKKLNGAAKTSFTKKCVTDTVGPST